MVTPTPTLTLRLLLLTPIARECSCEGQLEPDRNPDNSTTGGNRNLGTEVAKRVPRLNKPPTSQSLGDFFPTLRLLSLHRFFTAHSTFVGFGRQFKTLSPIHQLPFDRRTEDPEPSVQRPVSNAQCPAPKPQRHLMSAALRL